MSVGVYIRELDKGATNTVSNLFTQKPNKWNDPQFSSVAILSVAAALLENNIS